MRAMTHDDETGSALVKRGSTAAELEPRIDRKKELGDVLVGHAVDRVLGDDVSPELKKALKSQIAPWAERLVRVTDELIRIPGTDIHIGIDPILGLLLPGAGDVITGAGSISLLFLALEHRLPTVAIGRMVANIAIDTFGGAVPILGDAFDIYWRANRKNLDILEKYRDDPKAEPTTTDKVLVYGGVGLVLLGIAIPLVLGMIFGISLGALLHG
ncbi:MAG: DUF4112 domain-containing protein [Sandaracinaceae bacterium]|nr:DUF4112 domain-containing protein [Sandaracinaceae bacterium]